MKVVPAVHHRWDLTPREAVALQRELSARVSLEDGWGDVRHVAGLDVGFEERNTVTRAAVALLEYPSLRLVEHAIAREPTSFPYVPGLLSFRELPALLKALEQLAIAPNLLLCDGQGIAHPRRFGIASHLGLLLDIPSIGVAKSRLIGEHGEPGEQRGAWAPLTDKGELVGAVLRTRTRVKPIYVSPGHRISLESAIQWTLACTGRYRLPETTRWAHRLASG